MSNDADTWLWVDPPSAAFGRKPTFELCDIIYDSLKGRWDFKNKKPTRVGRRYFTNPTTPIEIENALVAGNWK